jgi:hypothetical protein
MQRRRNSIFFQIHLTRSEYELVKKLGPYDNFQGLKSTAKEVQHKLFERNKLSAATVISAVFKVPLIHVLFYYLCNFLKLKLNKS